MELEMILNDNYEIDYYEAKQKKGTITKHITVNPENDYFDIKEVVYNGTPKQIIEIVAQKEPKKESLKSAVTNQKEA